MKKLMILSVLLIACSQVSKNGWNGEVKYNGALKNIMHDGDISSKIDVSNLKEIKNLYALGALENLKGEILILNNHPIMSSVENNSIRIDNTFKKNATLLVYTSVQEWDSIDIPENITSYSKLEDYILNVAKKTGINVNKPFPFLLDGKANRIDIHVIHWVDGDTVHTHEKHKNSGLKGSYTDQNVNILGFYSVKHHGLFTHRSTNMHLHVKTESNNVSGHLDNIILGEKMRLRLPR